MSNFQHYLCVLMCTLTMVPGQQNKHLSIRRRKEKPKWKQHVDKTKMYILVLSTMAHFTHRLSMSWLCYLYFDTAIKKFGSPTVKAWTSIQPDLSFRPSWRNLADRVKFLLTTILLTKYYKLCLVIEERGHACCYWRFLSYTFLSEWWSGCINGSANE